ncbi:MAG: DUF1667 domain-containing protein [Bacillota bacterium]
MNTMELTCIICPNGCDLQVAHEDGKVVKVDNALCSKGRDYASEELTNPVRTLTTTVRVVGGELPLVSVRTDGPIPKSQLREAMQIVRALQVQAPVSAGTVLKEHILGTNANLIATRAIKAK